VLYRDGRSIRAEARIMSKSYPLALASVFAVMLGVGSGITGAQEVPRLRPLSGEVVGPPLVIDHNAATTVQLPTFSFFSISTTVMVPDSGTGFIGGVGRAGSSSRSNGLGSRSSASGIDAGGISIGVQIHDLKEMDRALLADKRARDAAAAAAAEVEQRWTARFERAKQSTAGRPTMSVAEARRAAAGGERGTSVPR
jgi:hypothetical protein